MNAELFELLEIAKHAASLAAAVHRRALNDGDIKVDTKRSISDLVTETDREAEQELVRSIRAARENDSIIGEEGTNQVGSSDVKWILDPLDGTTNFVHKYSAHAVAVGLEINGRRTIGVVHDSFSNRVYAGVVGEGATCDGKPITVRDENNLKHALIGTGFLPNANVRREQANLLRIILPRVRDIRRSGCPSLDICNVAFGTLDGFYECGLGPWDITAAAAIAEAAGATVQLLNSGVFPNPLVVVANRQLASALIDLLIETGAVEEPL
ncbi:MAG TPA: inositol monophosphatase family protein [Pyrinomonadaceae bacterium]